MNGAEVNQQEREYSDAYAYALLVEQAAHSVTLKDGSEGMFILHEDWYPFAAALSALANRIEEEPRHG